MAIQISAINGMGSYTVTGSTVTATGMKDNDIMHMSEDFLASDGVVNLTTDLLVTQNSPTGKTVLVSVGTAYVLNRNYTRNQNIQTRFWRCVNDANVVVTIADNVSGNARIDLIYIRVDPSISAGTDGQLSANIGVIQGTPSATPVIPSIPSDGKSYYILGKVTVANGFATLLNANITSLRVLCKVNGQLISNIDGITITNSILSSGTKLDRLADANITYYGMARQAIMNGNFDVWQRGTSTVNPPNASFVADRWAIGFTNTGTLPTTITHSRQLLTSGDLANSFYHYRIATNGSGSGFGASDEYFIEQKIEFATRALVGASKTVTVSFYAKSSIAGKKMGLYLVQQYGTGGSPSSAEIINGTNFTLTSSWTKYTATVTLNTLVGKTFGTNNDDVINVRFLSMWGTTTAVRVGAGATAQTFLGSGNIDIIQVLVNAGGDGLPFQPIAFGEELARCKRYYETGIFRWNPQNSDTSRDFKMSILYQVEKRTDTPTVTKTDITNIYTTTNILTNLDKNGMEWAYKAAQVSDMQVTFAWTSDAEI